MADTKTKNLFLYVAPGQVESFKNGHLNLQENLAQDEYYNYIVYLDGTKKEIATRGKVFAADNTAEITALATRVDTSIGTPEDTSANTTLYGLIKKALATADLAVSAAGVTSLSGDTGDNVLFSVSGTGDGSAKTGDVAISPTTRLSNAVGYAEDASNKLAGIEDGSTVIQLINAAKQDILTGGAEGTIAAAYDTLLEVSQWIATTNTSTGDIVSNLNKLNSSVNGLETAIGSNGAEKSGIYKLIADASTFAKDYTDSKVTKSTVTYTAKNGDTPANLAAGNDGSILFADSIAQIKEYVDALASQSSADSIKSLIDSSIKDIDASIDNLQALIGGTELGDGTSLMARISALESADKVVTVNQKELNQFVTVESTTTNHNTNVSIGVTLASLTTPGATSVESGLVDSSVLVSYVDNVLANVWVDYSGS